MGWMALCITNVSFAQDESASPTVAQVEQALQKAVEFFSKSVSTEGAYVYRWSSDLSRGEGESVVGKSTAWLEPPGTPAVGLAYLQAYQLTRRFDLLEAALATADALIRGQLQSGGWDDRIEFAANDRALYAYRVDGGEVGKRRNTTTFDDNKTQSAIRFLQQLDRELNFENERLHSAVLYALKGVLDAQYSNGAWPQRYSAPHESSELQNVQANFPAQWSREFPEVKYSDFYTLNDGTISDLIETMLEAHAIYNEEDYLQAARRGGEFLIAAQLPAPQPGWAQQYDFDMHPCWARKFEPPAITGGESQRVLRTLILVYRYTLDDKYLTPIAPALDYYESCPQVSGKVARFYELNTNRPLFFTKDYQLTYSHDDMPTHYSFLVDSKFEQIRSEFEKAIKKPLPVELPVIAKAPKKSLRLASAAAAAVRTLDVRGAWVTQGKLKGDEVAQPIIESRVFASNLRILSEYLASQMR